MTTSNEEIPIKPIIVSHNYHQTSSSLENNIDCLPKTSSAYKRVSFGNSKGTVVETFVYESVPIIEEGNYGPFQDGGSQTNTRQRDSSLSKVKVRTLESQIPYYIAPPATITGGSQTKVNGALSSASERSDVLTSSSPLPSLQVMDEGTENPFRPDGRLSHEVDPIVECYKKRPFPSSTESEYVDGTVTNVASSPPSSPAGKKAAVPHPAAAAPPVSKLSKNGGGRESSAAATKPQDIKLTLTTADGRNTQLEVHHKQLTSPKAGHAEVVHIGEKRKRCGCCSIQ